MLKSGGGEAGVRRYGVGKSAGEIECRGRRRWTTAAYMANNAIARQVEGHVIGCAIAVDWIGNIVLAAWNSSSDRIVSFKFGRRIG